MMNKQTSLNNRIIHGTLVIILISLSAKIIAFVKEALLANYLGTTEKSDAYYMVSSIQQVLYPMLSVGIWKVFLPVYKKNLAQGKSREANEISNKVITFSYLVSILLVLFLYLFAKEIVSVCAPGFDEKTKILCAELVRISAPMYMFIVVAAIYAAMLQCYNKFLGSQIREIITHIPTIVFLIFWYPKYGVRSLAYALIIGGVLRLVVELPFVDWGYKYKVDFRIKNESFLKMLKRLPAALISEGATQINLLVDKIMGSTFSAGTISGLNYANKLVNVISGLLSSAIATAIYPQMAELVALKKNQELEKIISHIIKLFCIVIIPISTACILFSNKLIEAVYKRGNFDEQSVKLTAGIFACYSIGLLFIACSEIINNVFYAEEDLKTPMYISMINLLVNVTLNIVLSLHYGVNGLAMATSITAIVTFVLRLIWLKKIVVIKWGKIYFWILKIILISGISCGLAYFLGNCFFENIYANLVIATVGGIGIYVLLGILLGITEIKSMIKYLLKFVKRS